jgi:hypothetical protein
VVVAVVVAKRELVLPKADPRFSTDLGETTDMGWNAATVVSTASVQQTSFVMVTDRGPRSVCQVVKRHQTAVLEVFFEWQMVVEVRVSTLLRVSILLLRVSIGFLPS